MNWRHRIAVVMLICLAALPLAGTICAMTCLSGSSAVAAHHEDGKDCESPAPASSGASADASTGTSSAHARIGVLSDYDCRNHGGVLPQVATAAAQRADLSVISAPAASDPIHPLFRSVTTFGTLFQYTPPGTAPPTTTPLVLRV